jgi:dTDP-6-deoxy-L-talose 4-dehydrogenase (NAD+)
MKKNIIVSGANGFIGTHVLLQGLRLFPDYQWIATSANPQKAVNKPWYNKAEFIPYDYHLHPSDFPFRFSEHDILIHSAWGFLPFFKKDEHLTVELPAQKNFIRRCVENGLQNLSVLGTCYEYGMQEGCLDEEKNPACPIMPYPEAKVRLHDWITENFPQINLTWMRLFYMYGEGQSEKSLIPQLEKAIAEGKEKFDMSKGDQVRDYLKVEDMAELIIRVALKRKNIGIVNICSGQPITVIDLVKKYLNENNKSIQLNPGVFPYPDYEPFAFWGSRKKLNAIMD